MSNPWDILAKEDQGDNDIDVLFAAVGRSLSDWEILEGTLGQIFADLCGSQTEAPARAYGVVVSCAGRLDMLREVFGCFEHRRNPDVAAFPIFLNDVGRFGARRNEIAHGHAVSITSGRIHQGFFWCPSRYSSRKTMSSAARMELFEQRGSEAWLAFGLGNYAYNSCQIDHYTEHFRDLNRRASQFLTSLMMIRVPHDADNSGGGTGA